MLHRLLKYDPGHAGRNRADDQQPSQLRVGVRTFDLSAPDRSANTRDDLYPILPVYDEKRQRRGEMSGHDKSQKVIGVLIDTPAQQTRQKNAVPQA